MWEPRDENLLLAMVGPKVSLGRGRWLLRHLTRTFREPDLGVTAELEISTGRDGVPRCTRLDLRGANVPERVPLRSLVRASVAMATVGGPIKPRGTYDSELKRLNKPFVPERPPRAYTRVTDDFLRDVAAVYRRAIRDGRRDPARAVMEWQAKRDPKRPVSHSRARAWIKEARDPERGFLRPTEERRAGELRTRKGKR